MTNNKIKIKALYDLTFYYMLNDKLVLMKLKKNKEYYLDYELVKLLARKKCVETLDTEIKIEENKSNKLDFEIFVFLYYIYKLKEFTIDELKNVLENNYIIYNEEKLNNLIDFLIKTNKLTYSINTSKYKLLTQIKKQ